MLPPNVTEILAPEPLEISGVAAVPNGYAVVGDETPDHGRIWPIGDRWAIQPQVKGPESMDVGYAPSGEQLWLVLGEDDHTLGDLAGGTFTFPSTFKEVCGRGLEGLSIRWHQGVWEAAVVWEGGFFKPNCEAPTPYALPRIALLHWKPGTGSPGLVQEFDLKVPRLENGQRFRAPDLVWAGDNLLVLLSSLDKGNKTFSHTWILSFDQKGNPTASHINLRNSGDRIETKKIGKPWIGLWTELDSF